MVELPERIAARIQPRDDGCWAWLGCVHRTGYGCLKLDGKMLTAHRVIYESLVGPVDPALHLDHLCRNRACVNPGHLEPVTCRENIMRGEGLAAINARKTHCIRGHELAGSNLAIYSGKRQCRECLNRATRQRRARKRAA